VRLLRLEQGVIEDLARWYGPAGNKSYAAAAQAVAAWLARLRGQLDGGHVGPDWRLCDAQPPLRLEGCWRVHFSPWDRTARSGAVYPAPGPRDGRIVVDIVIDEGTPGIRVLAVGPKYAGKGPGRQEWVYRHADRRRQHAYERGGGSR
jgi:hypothetical protein